MTQSNDHLINFEQAKMQDQSPPPLPSNVSSKPGTCLLTVNVADYFQVGTLRSVIKQDRWVRFETRLEANTERTLDLLDRYQTKATFFILGWIATELPGVVREVVRRGHEVASLGYLVRSLKEMPPSEFRREVTKAKDCLEEVTQNPVQGYRIPQGWISYRDEWVTRVLAEVGYRYDSSLRPFMWIPQRERWCFYTHCRKVGDKDFWEFPLPSVNFAGFHLPIAGGNYLRQAPPSLMRHAVSSWCRKTQSPFIMYFHVWELDPDQPRVTGAPFLQKIRQYRNLERMPHLIEDYLQHYSFMGIGEYLGIPSLPAHLDQGVTEKKPIPPMEPVCLSADGDSDHGTYKDQEPDCSEVSSTQQITIVVPCHNEEKVIPYLAKTLNSVEEVLSDEYKLQFVFVDDCSKDRTWEALKEAFGSRTDCTLVHHPFNLGVAAAILTGIREAGTEIVCSMDCDCSYDPHQLREMLRMMGPGIDLVTASPYHPDGAVLNVPRWRLGLSRTLSGIYRLVLKQKLATYTSCFRVYRRQAVINLKIKRMGFLGVAETLVRLDQQGSRIVECPAVLEGRLFGESKMRIIKTILGHLNLLAEILYEKVKSKKDSPASSSVFPTEIVTPSHMGETPHPQ